MSGSHRWTKNSGPGFDGCRWASAAVASLLALALVGCGPTVSPSATGAHTGATTPTAGGSSKATQSTPDPQPPPPPVTGVCRNYPYLRITGYSNNAPQVACSSPHTAYTFAVRRLPPRVIVPGVAISNTTVQGAAAMICQRAFGRFVGGTPTTRALSRLSVTYFVAPQRGFNRGAHWVRCDVVALLTRHRLAPLPKRPLAAFLDGKNALRRYGVCSSAAPTSGGSQLVACMWAHEYRAVTAISLGPTHSTYPGLSVAKVWGQHKCRSHIASLVGTSDGYTFAWTYPTKHDWRAHQRFGYCWLKTTH